MHPWRILYWFFAGSLIGIGLISEPAIGWLLLLPAGLILTIVGLLRLGRGDIWALAVGFGLLPAVVWIRGILEAQALLADVPPCPATNAVTAPGIASAACGGPVPAYWYGIAAGFTVIALAGLAWPLVAALMRRARPGRA